MIDFLVAQFGLDKDTVINSLPFILTEIREYTNQYFLTTHHIKVGRIESNKIYIEGEYDLSVQKGDSIELLNSENNLYVYQIKDIQDGYIELEQELIDELSNDNIVLIKLVFKGVSLKTISGFIKYDSNFQGQEGINSQSLGGYSVTFATSNGETMYPLELYGGLNSLKKINDDYCEYRRKGYVRL